MKHSFPMRKVLCLVCFLVLAVFHNSFIYQIFDFEQMFVGMSHETKVASVSQTDTDTDKADADSSGIDTDGYFIETDYDMDTDDNRSNHENEDKTKQIAEEVSSDETIENVEEEVDVLMQLHKSDWNLILVNKQHPVPEDYSFPMGSISKNMKCDARILLRLQQMMEAAGKENITLSIKSPYRNEQRQEYLFNKKIKTYMKAKMSYLQAYKETAQVVTLPGSSEHQIGLALDIVSSKYSLLEQEFGETDAGIWLEAHAHEYGFIVRYPKDKEDITGIEYEPWHFRYVGVPAATYIYENHLTLEEFVQLLAE